MHLRVKNKTVVRVQPVGAKMNLNLHPSGLKPMDDPKHGPKWSSLSHTSHHSPEPRVTRWPCTLTFLPISVCSLETGMSTAMEMLPVDIDARRLGDEEVQHHDSTDNSVAWPPGIVTTLTRRSSIGAEDEVSTLWSGSPDDEGEHRLLGADLGGVLGGPEHILGPVKY
jgi:hypothetical protein